MIAISMILFLLFIMVGVLYLITPSLDPEGGGWNPAKTVLGFFTLVFFLAAAGSFYCR